MARRRRIHVPGNSVHVMNRGHNKQQIFDDDIDCEFFLKTVRKSAERYDFEVHSFSLMKNHFHLLITPRAPTSISDGLKAIKSRYTQYYNRKHKRTGSIWNERYHDVPIESAWQWLVCMRYIELNPVRAGVVEDPGAYRWSSYQVHASGSSSYPWLVSHPVYDRLAIEAADRQAIYRALCGAPLSEAELTLMRHPPSLQLMTTEDELAVNA